jgi:hypothetical protein
VKNCARNKLPTYAPWILVAVGAVLLASLSAWALVAALIWLVAGLLLGFSAEDSNRESKENNVLYKYRGLHTDKDYERTRAMVLNGECYLSDSSRVNDPFEFDVELGFDPDDETKDEYYDRMMDEREMTEPRERQEQRKLLAFRYEDPDERRRLLNLVLEDLGIFCLSRTRESVAMWSHYAFGHRGICVGFDRDDLEREIDPSWFYLEDVEYDDQMPKIDMSRYKLDAPKQLTRKSTEWHYEQETRLLKRSCGSERIYKTKSCREVVLGCEISTEHRHDVLEWCKMADAEIRVLQAVKNKGTYSLDFDPVT